MTAMRRIGGVLLVGFSMLLSQSGLDVLWGEAANVSSTKSTSSKCNRSAFRVVLDVGHTIVAPGAISARGVPEYEFNLRLAKQTQQKLIESGFGSAALLITADPPRVGLVKRVARANSLPADLLLSIHHDSVPNRFLETWEFEGKEH